MTQPQLILLTSIGGSILAVVAAACLMIFRGAEDQGIARRISGLRQGIVAQAPLSLYSSVPLLLLARLGRGNA
jgi:hypothetical protein